MPLHIARSGLRSAKSVWRGRFTRRGRSILAWAACAVGLTLLFATVLLSWAQLALESDLHSYGVLIPFLSAFLIFRRRKSLPSTVRPAPLWTLVSFMVGALALGCALANRESGLSHSDFLSCLMLAFVCWQYSAGFFFLGTQWMRTLAFPCALLLLAIPLPDGLVQFLETSLAAASADLAAAIIRLAGIPIHQVDQVIFHLPGIVLEVAPQCSGVRSTLVLFIIGLLAAFEFLRSGWTRLLLVTLVLPLGILRNACRIFLISWLCVRINPGLVESAVHDRGGPFFFLISLGVVLGLVIKLRRLEAGRIPLQEAGNHREEQCP